MREYTIGAKGLTYNPETGLFTYPRSGRIAGSIKKGGYRAVRADCKEYQAHRLAWFLVYGAMPTLQIDHINGVPDDNRISNLREVTASENQQNKRVIPSNKKSGAPIGVTFHKKTQKYQAQIAVDGKFTYLGLFASSEDARRAYLLAKTKLHPSSPINWEQTQ